MDLHAREGERRLSEDATDAAPVDAGDRTEVAARKLWPCGASPPRETPGIMGKPPSARSTTLHHDALPDYAILDDAEGADPAKSTILAVKRRRLVPPDAEAPRRKRKASGIHKNEVELGPDPHERLERESDADDELERDRDRDADGEEEEEEEENEAVRVESRGSIQVEENDRDQEGADNDEKDPTAADVKLDNGGYYAFQPGEIINQTYEIKYQQGRGVFSNVVFAKRRRPQAAASPPNAGPAAAAKHDLVAVKILRKHNATHRAGSNEESILKDIHKLPSASREYIVDFIESFYHQRHLCLVFRAMKLNLRQLLVKYGRNTGINIDGVRRYGSHVFSALACLRRLGIVHADVKLDNIIVSADLRTAKLCDFGSAFYASEARSERTMYLVSRFYRAPELVLGLSGADLGAALDVWSLGTCLFELYSGSVLFPGRTNNEMLALFMRVKGKLPAHLVKRHLSAAKRLDCEPLFDPETLAFRQITRSPRRKAGRAQSSQSSTKTASASAAVRLVHVPAQPESANTISRLVHEAHPDTRDRITTAERKHLTTLLDRALAVDPAQRITPAEALALPFFAVSNPV